MMIKAYVCSFPSYYSIWAGFTGLYWCLGTFVASIFASEDCLSEHTSCIKYTSYAQDIFTVPYTSPLMPSTSFFLTGLGKTTPDPSASITLEGVEVPLGTGVPSGVNDTCLLYNEYPFMVRAVCSGTVPAGVYAPVPGQLIWG